MWRGDEREVIEWEFRGATLISQFMSGGHKGSMKMSLVLLTLSMLATTGWSIPYPAEQVPTVTTQNQTSSTTPSPDLTGDRFNEFDWKLCKALVETEHGNIVISPISLKLVLVMIYEGANGNTAQELATVLGLSREDMGRQLTRTKFSNIVGALKSSKGEYDLNLGTSIFIDRSVTPKPSYVRKLQSFYEAQIEQVDFSKTPEAIKAINAWAAYSTKGQIQNFLSEGDASASTILMLLNAIYFKGQWMYTFPSNQTAPGIFYAGGKKPINVNYMNTVNYYYYMDAPEINAQVIRLPYLGNKLAMYFIIPNNRTGLPELVNKIDPFVLRKHTQNMYENLVELSLPSFKIDFTAYLGPILTKLGIKKMFSNGAELNEIAEVSNNSIAVSNVLQKAGIQVNEEGSTAFAATEGEVINKFGDSTVVLKLDHPFLFFIKDEKTDTVLFVGNLVNPNPSNDAVNPDNVKTTTPVTPDNVKTTITPVTPATETNKTTAKPEPANPSNNGSMVTTGAQEGISDRFGAINTNAINNERFNFFDSELLEELSSKSEGNLIISSASIKSILAMILEGSQGETYNQLLLLLRLPTNHTAVQTVLHDFQDSLRNFNDKVTMKSASRIFLSQNLSPDPRYKRLIQQHYYADIDRTNFATPEITANNINNWVKLHTQGFIPNLIDHSAIHPDSHLIVANAIYFKGDWREEFQATSTVVECFYPTPDQCKQSYMMTSATVFNYTYYAALDAQVIKLPYQGEKYTMIIVLPTKKDGIMQLSKDLSHRSLQDIEATMNEMEVIAKIPRFAIEYKTDLVSILQQMGAKDMFSDAANIPGIIAGGRKSKVNAFLHTAKIEVNEKGTKAGAASAGSVVPLMSSFNVPQFNANHPFFFYIYDQENSVILFSGKLLRPDEVSPDVNQLDIQPLSAERTTINITSHEPHSKPYPYNSNKQMKSLEDRHVVTDKSIHFP